MKRKGDKLHGKVVIIILTAGLIKKTLHKWVNIFLHQKL